MVTKADRLMLITQHQLSRKTSKLPLSVLLLRMNLHQFHNQSNLHGPRQHQHQLECGCDSQEAHSLAEQVAQADPNQILHLLQSHLLQSHLLPHEPILMTLPQRNLSLQLNRDFLISLALGLLTQNQNHSH